MCSKHAQLHPFYPRTARFPTHLRGTEYARFVCHQQKTALATEMRKEDRFYKSSLLLLGCRPQHPRGARARWCRQCAGCNSSIFFWSGLASREGWRDPVEPPLHNRCFLQTQRCVVSFMPCCGANPTQSIEETRNGSVLRVRTRLSRARPCDEDWRAAVERTKNMTIIKWRHVEEGIVLQTTHSPLLPDSL